MKTKASRTKGTPLHIAAEKGLIDLVDLLIQAGEDLNAMREGEEPCGCEDNDLHTPVYTDDTPLRLAVRNGYDDIAYMLMAAKADVNAGGGRTMRTPLLFACRNHNTNLVQQLLHYRASTTRSDTITHNYNTPLAIAVVNNDPSIVKLLVEARADMYNESHDDYDRDRHSEDEEEDERIELPLFIASRKGFYSVVNVLLQAGIDVNRPAGKNKITILFVTKDLETARAMLAAKADVNHRAYDGSTPLHKVTSPSIAALFIQARADLDASTDGNETALMKASTSGHDDIVKLLLTAGAAICCLDDDGESALCKAHHKSIAKMLIKYGAPLPLDGDRALSQVYEDTRSHQVSMFEMMNSGPYLIPEIWDVIMQFTKQYDPEWKHATRIKRRRTKVVTKEARKVGKHFIRL